MALSLSCLLSFVSAAQIPLGCRMQYRFANSEINTERHEFRTDGEIVRLEPQVFDLLVLLVQHPGRLVSRDELVETVWGGRIVSESTISARINAARRAARESGARQASIATAPRRCS